MPRTILYAEDNIEEAEMNMRYFYENRFIVAHARDGEEALRMFCEQNYDLVLLDIEMPKKNGFQVLNEIRSRDLTTPVVFLTSSLSSERAVKGLNAGANDYIRKNLSIDEVIARIQAVLRTYVADKDSIVHITPDSYVNRSDLKLVTCGVTHKLSLKECNLLCYLVAHANTSCDRKMLAFFIWGDNDNGSHYMYKVISRFRKVLSRDKCIIIESEKKSGAVGIRIECS